MPQNNQTSAQYLQWEIPEYRVPKRSKNWYVIAGILLVFALLSCFFAIKSWRLVFLGTQSNFIFALILIMSAILMYFNEKRPPLMLTIKLDSDGVKVGQKFYDYSAFKNFCVLYRPKQSIKKLYLEFKNTARPRLSIPLRRMDALTARTFLAKYLDEDFERENEPLSEQLTKMLKL
jgi:hypothetical protein